VSAPTRIPLADNVLYPLALGDGGVLLIDAGPDAPAHEGGADSWEALRVQLGALGIGVADVRLVLVTHAHLDHAGLAWRWAEAGATILGGAGDVAAIGLGQASREAQRALQLADLERHGCPGEVIEGMRSPRVSGGRHPEGLRWPACPAEAIEVAADGYALADGRKLEVIEAPGHTPGNLVGFVRETGELFSGDTLLPTSVTTVPTPGMHYPDAVSAASEEAARAERWPSLPPFVATIERLRRLPVRRVLPGHGQVVEDPLRLFDRFEQHHARRAVRVRAALEGGEPSSAYAVAKTMFPRIPPRRLGQAITEVLGHLDLLEAAGRVEVVRDRAGVRYRLR
jgi:glyoxylase-like metal-dependent hydrolase (beta-lactamase superfamily II)